jgi:hypothetical protein
MPNPHISDRQVMRYMASRSQHHNQATAAAMAGISERSARRIDKDPRFPSQKKQPRTWRTRPDPLETVWPRVLEMLKIPGIMAVTIFEELQDELGAEILPDSVRRTIERRIAKWRALHGGQGDFLPPTPRSRPSSPVRFHRRGQPRGHHRRRALAASPLSFPAGL